MIALAIATALLGINLAAFLAFWWDKEAARAGGWRVREDTLLGLAVIGGSLGALAAQRMLRHKTRKQPFRTGLPAIVAVHAAIGMALLVFPGHLPDLLDWLARA